MAKLFLFWDNRGKLTRAAIIWVLVFQLVHIVLWYIDQNVRFTSMDSAHTMNLVSLAFTYLEGAAGVMVIIGLIVEFFNKGLRKNDGSVKVAEGIWMVKK